MAGRAAGADGKPPSLHWAAWSLGMLLVFAVVAALVLQTTGNR